MYHCVSTQKAMTIQISLMRTVTQTVIPMVKRPLPRFMIYFDAHSKLQMRLCSTKNEIKPQNVQQLLEDAAVFENESGEGNAWSTSPYPKGINNRRLQSNHALRPRVDPKETSIILFPGEGSQFVGMGESLLKFPGVRDIFDAANDILKYDLLSICMKGPKSSLDEMKHSQVAVMVCSFAALERLREERPSSVETCIATAGFGIGELTALTFAGAISFERAVRLAQLRGEAMQTTSQLEPAGMLTVLYRPDTKIHEVMIKAKEHAAAKGVEKPVCEVAHYLFPQCKVLAGHTQCLEYIEQHLKELKLMQVRRLNVKGAPHTSLMEPAAQLMWKYLDRSNLHNPVISVHSCLDGKAYRNESDIIRRLTKQMMRPVRWEQMMHILYERPVGKQFPNTFECGPGSTLKTILKMVNAKAYDVCKTVF